MCVLVVEDELLIRMSTALTLEELGLAVMCAADGNDAIELIDRHAAYFSALVTDLNMPGGVDGRQVVEHMRRHYPTIPIYLVSAQTASIAEPWRRELQVTVVDKPFDADQLAAMVSRALN